MDCLKRFHLALLLLPIASYPLKSNLNNTLGRLRSQRREEDGVQRVPLDVRLVALLFPPQRDEMKSRHRILAAIAALPLTLGGVVLAAGALPSAEAQSAPEACQCTRTLLLGAGTTASTYINNCQCGAMQCIALASQALQCK